MMPIRVPETWFLTNSLAASCAAVSRLGDTSVAHMEPETSSVRMIDVLLIEMSWVTRGRAAPIANAAIAPRKRAIGTWRRQRDRFGIAWRISETLENRTALRRWRRNAQWRTEQQQRSTSRPGQRRPNVMLANLPTTASKGSRR
jgi:hypothetical protein